jgi:hypothetical protein
VSRCGGSPHERALDHDHLFPAGVFVVAVQGLLGIGLEAWRNRSGWY